jgi:chromosome segregation ATPase
MSRTEEISTGVKAVETSAGEARFHAAETLEFAREQIEFAYSHGWGGVAESMTLASEPLENVTEQLTTAETSCETAHTTLDQISDQMSRSEVVAHLATALTELDTAHTAIEGSIPLVDEAIQGAEQADHESLTAQLQNLRSEVEELLGLLAQSRADTDTERQEAENLGQEAQAPGSSGN